MKNLSLRNTLLIVALLLPSWLFGQTVIQGHVLTLDRKPIPDVSVMLMHPKDSTVVAFKLTDEKGFYSLSYSGNTSHIIVGISALDLKPQQKKVENRSQTVDFITEEGSVMVEEVVVKANKIWGERDTINYLVSSFKTESDIVIGDVLKKLPGISVAKSGEISYKGRPINKFYIEDMDLLQGRYGLATNNISAKDIASVQVYENHQPIKALEDVDFSNEAAINLRLKQGRRGVFSLNALLGAGINPNFLWREELAGMYFTHKRQHLFTLKSNNDGTNILKELSSFEDKNYEGNLQMAFIQKPTPPAISFERYNFNTTHTAASTNLFKLKNSATLNANIIFASNKERSHSYARSTYSVPGEQMRIIEEDMTANGKSNSLEGDFRYNLNSELQYFNNQLKLTANWVEEDGAVLIPERIGQELSKKAMGINNKTHWIIRNESGKGVDIISRNSYRTEPHQLRVSPGLYADRLNGGLEYASLLQSIRHRSFYSNTFLRSLSLIQWGKFSIDPLLILRAEHQNLGSEMNLLLHTGEEQRVPSPHFRNDMNWTALTGILSLAATYQAPGWYIQLLLSADYQHRIIHQKDKDGEKIEEGKVYFLPKFLMRKSLNTKSEFSLNSNLNRTSPNLQNLYTGYLLQNYRKLNRYDTKLFDRYVLNVGASYDYKDVMDMLFAKASAFYTRHWSQGIYGQRFEDILSVIELKELKNNGETLSIGGEVSKGFYWKNLNISLKSYWGASKNDLLRQDELLQYRNRWINCQLKTNLQPAKWLSTQYQANWRSNKGKIEGGDQFAPIHDFRQDLSLNFLLPWHIEMLANIEHYYNSAVGNNNRHFFLADLNLGYKGNRVQYTLVWRNIMNTKKYITSYYSSLDSYYSEYDIRPSSIMFTVRFNLL